jgi:hypothetical protein
VRPGRPLIRAEHELLASFAQAVDLDRVRIHSRRSTFGDLVAILTRGAAIALGHQVVVPGAMHLPTLAHEITHVVQFERWGPIRYFAAGFWNQFVLRGLLGRDVYQWEYAEGKSFEEYGMEQQGQIVQDCYDPTSPRRTQALLVSPFAPGARREGAPG